MFCTIRNKENHAISLSSLCSQFRVKSVSKEEIKNCKKKKSPIFLFCSYNVIGDDAYMLSKFVGTIV